MNLLLSIIIWFLNNFWLGAIILVIISIVISTLYNKIKKPKTKISFPQYIIPILFVASFLFFFLGRYVTIPLIYHFGEQTNALVVSVERTSSRYNEEPIYKHNIIFYDIDGQTIETSFRTSDFNVYPMTNSVRYPGSGDTFTLRYMKSLPSEFIIIRDETQHELTNLIQKKSELQNKLEFDSSNTKFQKELDEIEIKIKALEDEKKENKYQQLLEGGLSLVSAFYTIDSLQSDPNETSVYIEARYKDSSDFVQNALFNLSLETKELNIIHPTDTFDKHLGIFDNHYYSYDSTEDIVIIHDLMTNTVSQLADTYPDFNTKSQPYLLNNLLFEDDHLSKTSQVLNLKTGSTKEVPYELVSRIISSSPWHHLTPHHQTATIELLLSMETIEDYQHFLNETLKDYTQPFNHNSAETGLHFTEKDDEISMTLYLKVSDILFNQGAQRMLREELKNYAQYDVIGIEENGISYALGVNNRLISIVKGTPSNEVETINTDIELDSLNFTSIHLEDRILLINEQVIIDINKKDFTISINPVISK